MCGVTLPFLQFMFVFNNQSQEYFQAINSTEYITTAGNMSAKIENLHASDIVGINGECAIN